MALTAFTSCMVRLLEWSAPVTWPRERTLGESLPGDPGTPHRLHGGRKSAAVRVARGLDAVTADAVESQRT